MDDHVFEVLNYPEILEFPGLFLRIPEKKSKEVLKIGKKIFLMWLCVLKHVKTAVRINLTQPPQCLVGSNLTQVKVSKLLVSLDYVAVEGVV